MVLAFLFYHQFKVTISSSFSIRGLVQCVFGVVETVTQTVEQSHDSDNYCFLLTLTLTIEMVSSEAKSRKA